MRKIGTVAVVVLLGATAGCRAAESAADTASEPIGLTAVIPAVVPAVVKVPEPVFSRTIESSAPMPKASDLIDRCKGPVAVELGSGWPVLVAEHDYCGGSEWISRLDNGDAVRLDGPGIESGLYVVEELRFQLRGKAMAADLPDTDVVLQTCVTKKKLVLAGLRKLG